jgi:hypothetical protein
MIENDMPEEFVLEEGQSLLRQSRDKVVFKREQTIGGHVYYAPVEQEFIGDSGVTVPSGDLEKVLSADDTVRVDTDGPTLDEENAHRAVLSLTAICIRSLPFLAFIIFAFLTIGNQNISPLKGGVFLFVQAILLILSLWIWVRR